MDFRPVVFAGLVWCRAAQRSDCARHVDVSITKAAAPSGPHGHGRADFGAVARQLNA